MQTLTSRDICERLSDKIGGFVSTAFDQASGEFRSLYRNRVSEFPGGFRRIDLVPKSLMTRKIVRDASADPAVAHAILKNWYVSKPALREKAAALLQSLGYEVAAPDFDNDSIAHRVLGQKHIRSEDGAWFFSPGEAVEEMDQLELTVMVALLGWFPEPEEDTQNEQTAS